MIESVLQSQKDLCWKVSHDSILYKSSLMQYYLGGYLLATTQIMIRKGGADQRSERMRRTRPPSSSRRRRVAVCLLSLCRDIEDKIARDREQAAQSNPMKTWTTSLSQQNVETFLYSYCGAEVM